MDVRTTGSQSTGSMPKEETSNKANNSVSKNMWIKLKGPAAESLSKAFFGPAVVVLQGNKGARRVAEAAEEDAAIVPIASVREAEGGGAMVTGRGGTTVSVSPTRIVIAGTAGAGKSIEVLKTYRIVLLGRTGAGKSSLANTIFGEDVFKIKYTPTREYQAQSKSVHGRRITLVDTPDFFNTERSEEELKREIVRCISQCAPGPHAFFIVFKVDKFTKQEEAVITKILQYFSEEALKYVAIVFTHGDQLAEGVEIEEFVDQNKCLRDLVKKCGGRCHVVDNKYWKNNQEDEYRSNKFQVAELLNTTDKIMMENKGGCYTNEMLKAVRREIKEDGNRTSLGNMPQGHTSSKADNRVSKNVWIKLTGPGAESLVKALLRTTVIDLRKGENGGGEVKEEGEAATETEENTEEAATETEEEATGTKDEAEEAATETEDEAEEAATETEEEATGTKDEAEEAATETEDEAEEAATKTEEEATGTKDEAEEAETEEEATEKEDKAEEAATEDTAEEAEKEVATGPEEEAEVATDKDAEEEEVTERKKEKQGQQAGGGGGFGKFVGSLFGSFFGIVATAVGAAAVVGGGVATAVGAVGTAAAAGGVATAVGAVGAAAAGGGGATAAGGGGAAAAGGGGAAAAGEGGAAAGGGGGAAAAGEGGAAAAGGGGAGAAGGGAAAAKVGAAATAGVGVGAVAAAGGIIGWLASKLYPIYLFVRDFIKDLQQHSQIILLVIVFYSMLLLSFWDQLRMVGVILLFLLFVLLLLLSRYYQRNIYQIYNNSTSVNGKI